MSPASSTANNKRSSNAKLTIVLCVVMAIVLPMFVMANIHNEHSHHSYDDHKHKYNPYKYGYKLADHKGNLQWKQEESHSPMAVKGSYGYKDKHGIFREVSYVADKHGFRAHVKTNEPGTSSKNPAGVKMSAHPDPAYHKVHEMHGHDAHGHGHDLHGHGHEAHGHDVHGHGHSYMHGHGHEMHGQHH